MERGDTITESKREEIEGELRRRQSVEGWGRKGEEDTDTQADGEKSRNVKRQTHADGERGGSRERQRQAARETLVGKCRETERGFKNKFRKYFPPNL